MPEVRIPGEGKRDSGIKPKGIHLQRNSHRKEATLKLGDGKRCYRNEAAEAAPITHDQPRNI
jgi:hypothetical protein